jgi:energy-coupling factor transporter transmembrane protein EcfT
MDFTLMVGILLFIIVVYLIFKFVKKIIFAVISVFILIILIIAAIGGLAYLDFRSLSAQQDFVVNVVYAEGDSLLYGVQIPFDNAEPLTENVTGISNIKTLDVDEVSKDSGEFIVVIDDVLFKELIDGKTFTFTDVLPEGQFDEYNMTFTDVEVLRVMESDTPNDELLNVVFEKANIPSFLIETAKPIASEVLVSVLEEIDMTSKEAIFTLALSEVVQDQENVVSLVQGFKDDELQVYPERITFDLIKYIPTSIIEENLQE